MGSIQALIMTIFLWFNKNNQLANRLLSILTLSWSFTCAAFALQSYELWMAYPHLYKVTSIFTYLFFPPLFLYTKYITTGKKNFNPWDLVHFLPSVAYIRVHLPFFIMSAEEKKFLLENKGTEPFMIYLEQVAKIGDMVIIIQGIAYTLLSIWYLHNYRKTMLNNYSDEHAEKFDWLRRLVIINFALWSVGSIGAILNLMGKPIEFRFFTYYYLSIVVVIYFLSYYAIKQPHVFEPTIVKPDEEDDALSEEEKSIVEKLENHMDEKQPYLNKKLTLVELSDSLNVNRNKLSSIINGYYKKNFFDFINDYRVEEAKKLLTSKDHADFKLEFLASKSGFNSKATFNRIFKLRTGYTPSTYKADHNPVSA